MLKTAYLYRDEVNKKMAEIAFNPKYMFYNFGTYWSFDYKIADNSWDAMQFVSVDKDNHIIGYLTAETDRVHDKIGNLGIINFQDAYPIFAHDLGNFLTSIFDKFNFRKIEFLVVIGNPIESSYDKIISKYGGRIIGVKKESAKLIDNKYYDVKLYEIFKRDYDRTKRTNKVEYSEDYKRIRAEIENWPDYLKETYNVNFATSAHAKKLELKEENHDQRD